MLSRRNAGQLMPESVGNGLKLWRNNVGTRCPRFSLDFLVPSCGRKRHHRHRPSKTLLRMLWSCRQDHSGLLLSRWVFLCLENVMNARISDKRWFGESNAEPSASRFICSWSWVGIQTVEGPGSPSCWVGMAVAVVRSRGIHLGKRVSVFLTLRSASRSERQNTPLNSSPPTHFPVDLLRIASPLAHSTCSALRNTPSGYLQCWTTTGKSRLVLRPCQRPDADSTLCSTASGLCINCWLNGVRRRYVAPLYLVVEYLPLTALAAHPLDPCCRFSCSLCSTGASSRTRFGSLMWCWCGLSASR